MEKEHIYLVEVTFEAVIVADRGQGTERQYLELRTEVATFKDFNKSEAKKRAQDFFDRTLRYGLSKTGESVIKAIVPPNAIKNIALVDYEKFQEEMERIRELESSTGLVSTDVETVAEPAEVALEVGSD